MQEEKDILTMDVGEYTVGDESLYSLLTINFIIALINMIYTL